MRVLSVLLIGGAFFLLPLANGCGPNVAEEDLGQIVFELPDLPDAEKPFDMPELGPPLPASEPDRFAMPPPLP